MGVGWGADGLSALALTLRASVDEEGDGGGEQEEDEDYNCGYDAAGEASLGCCSRTVVTDAG